MSCVKYDLLKEPSPRWVLSSRVLGMTLILDSEILRSVWFSRQKLFKRRARCHNRSPGAGAALMNNTQIYAAITEKIIANLETAGSWKKLWQIPSPVSLNGHYYRGINRLILSSDPFQGRVYGTFPADTGPTAARSRKGEKATVVVFWKSSIHTDEVTKEQKKMFPSQVLPHFQYRAGRLRPAGP